LSFLGVSFLGGVFLAARTVGEVVCMFLVGEASMVGWELVPSPNSIASRLQTKNMHVEKHNNVSYSSTKFCFLTF
jgi:hypothetical protein